MTFTFDHLIAQIMTTTTEPLSIQNLKKAHAVLSQLRSNLTIEAFVSYIGHPDYSFLVFRDAQDVIAVCGYRMLETITRGTHCHLHDLAVDSQRRGQGVGRSVINALQAIVSGNGARWIFLDGVDDALGFYDRIGFQRHPATLLKLPVTA